MQWNFRAQKYESQIGDFSEKEFSLNLPLPCQFHSGIIQLSGFANYFLIILPEALPTGANFGNEILEETGVQ